MKNWSKYTVEVVINPDNVYITEGAIKAMHRINAKRRGGKRRLRNHLRRLATPLPDMKFTVTKIGSKL